MKCGLCGHDPACGFASVEVGDDITYLCHEDDHSCYEQWTVHGKRPLPYSYAVFTGGTGGHGVLVTQSWDEVAAEIQAKLVSMDVVVRRVDAGPHVSAEASPVEVADAWNLVNRALAAQEGKVRQNLAEGGLVALAGLLRGKVD